MTSLNLTRSVEPDLSLHRCDQLRRIVADAFLEDCHDFSNVLDARRRVAIEHDQIRLLADGDRAGAIRAAEVGSTVERADLDRLERRESALDEQLECALVGEAGNDAAAAGR